MSSTILHGDRRKVTLDELSKLGLHIHAIAYFPAEDALGNTQDSRQMKAELEEVPQTVPYERFVLTDKDARRIHRKGFYPHLADARTIVFQVTVTGSGLQLISPDGDVTTKIKVGRNQWFGVDEPGKRSWKMRLRHVESDTDRPQGDVLLANPEVHQTFSNQNQ